MKTAVETAQSAGVIPPFSAAAKSGAKRPMPVVASAWCRQRRDGRLRHVEAIHFEVPAQVGARVAAAVAVGAQRSEEHTSELQSLMRISYAVFCLKKKTKKDTT